MDFPVWGWIVFGVVVVIALAIDLIAHRGERADTRKQAYIWSAVWIAVGLAFCVFVWIVWGGQSAQEYLGAYLIEKSLSLDNLFVFLVIFSSLNIPHRYQRTVLIWGIIGALVFRAIFIFLGVAAIERWDWVSYVFGGILLFAAWRIFREDPLEGRDNKAVRWLSRRLPVTEKIHQHHFVVRRNGRHVVTPLLIALLAIELTDIMFAIDSVPAAFAITHDRFILYSSNAFAILGLRALYIALSATLERFKYLHYGLALILAFAAAKLILADWVHLPALVSVAIILVIIAVSIFASLKLTSKEERQERQDAKKDREASAPT